MTITRMMNDIKFEMLEDGSIVAHGSKGELYKVTLDGSDSVDSCSCLGWLHRAGRPVGRQDCKHVVAARGLAKRAADPLSTTEIAEGDSITVTILGPVLVKRPKTRAEILATLDDGMTVDEEVDLLMAESEQRKHGA